jgi:hypothetical protein
MQARKLDYLTRALRETERAKVDGMAAAEAADISAYVHKQAEEMVAKAEARHEAALAVKVSYYRYITVICN